VPAGTLTPGVQSQGDSGGVQERTGGDST